MSRSAAAVLVLITGTVVSLQRNMAPKTSKSISSSPAELTQSVEPRTDQSAQSDLLNTTLSEQVINEPTTQTEQHRSEQLTTSQLRSDAPTRESSQAPMPTRKKSRLEKPDFNVTATQILYGEYKAVVDKVRGECSERVQSPPVRAEPYVTSLLDSDIYLDTTGGREMYTGQWVTFFIVARTKQGVLTCADGDFFESTAWSSNNRPPVHPETVGQGVYRFKFRPVHPGDFTLSVNLFYSSSIGVARSWPTEAEMDSHSSMRWQDSSRERAKEIGHIFKRLRQKRDYAKLTRFCVDPHAEFIRRTVTVTVAGEVILPRATCTGDWRKGRGLEGSWLRAPMQGFRGNSSDQRHYCAPGYCEGDIHFLKTDGWVWVPDHCYLRLYNRESAWKCFSGKKFFWFGDSTLKQPATNIIEHLLGVPVLRRSYNWIKKFCPSGYKITKKKYLNKVKRATELGCVGPFEHRQWHINRVNPRNSSQSTELQLLWGGARTQWMPPKDKPSGIEHLLPDSKSPVKEAFHNQVLKDQTIIFLHEYIWDELARFDYAKFEPIILQLIKDLLENTTSLIHWDTAHPQCGTDSYEKPFSLCKALIDNKMETVGSYYNSMQMTKAIEATFADEPRVQVANRYLMAQPYTIGHDYCHHGLHYGAHEAFCHAYQPINPKACYRDWLVDKLEGQVWLNRICTDAPASFTEDTSIDIKVCYCFTLFVDSDFFTDWGAE